MDLLTKLGIDWRLLIAQLINFLIVLAVLYRLLYKPLLKFLDDRRNRISQSLVKAEEIDKEVAELKVRKEEVLTEARKQAQEIIKQTEAEADARRQEILKRVRAESAKVVEEARAKFTAEQSAQLQNLRQQAAKLVIQALTKLVGKLPAEQVDKTMVEEAIKEVNKRK